MFEAVAHVPLIVRYPAAFEPGTRVAALTQTHDVVATIYDLIGAERQIEWLGESSHSLLRARDGDARSYALCEFAFPVNMLERVTRSGRAFDLRRFFRAQRAYYRDDWKYIWTSDGRDMLYNLADDPTEQVNLIDSENDRARDFYLELEGVLARIPVKRLRRLDGDRVHEGHPEGELGEAAALGLPATRPGRQAGLPKLALRSAAPRRGRLGVHDPGAADFERQAYVAFGGVALEELCAVVVKAFDRGSELAADFGDREERGPRVID